MKIRFRVIGLVAFALLFLGRAALAADARQATISKVRGEVMVRLDNGEWQAAQVGTILHKHDEIKTSDGGFAELLLDKGEVGSVEVQSKSLFKLGTFDENPATGEKYTLLDLAIGKVLVHAEKLQGNSRFEVRTPTSTTGVRGTMFEVSVE